jgi:hypothetical protein
MIEGMSVAAEALGTPGAPDTPGTPGTLGATATERDRRNMSPPDR